MQLIIVIHSCSCSCSSTEGIPLFCLFGPIFSLIRRLVGFRVVFFLKWEQSLHTFSVCMKEVKVSYFSDCMFQLWDEAESGLPSGKVVGISGSDLHLYKEKRRYSHVHTCIFLLVICETFVLHGWIYTRSKLIYPFLLSLLERPDFNDAIIMRRGASVEHVVRKAHFQVRCFYTHNKLVANYVHSLIFVFKYLQCHRIHRTLASQFKYALVWVSSSFLGQRSSETHFLLVLWTVWANSVQLYSWLE